MLEITFTIIGTTAMCECEGSDKYPIRTSSHAGPNRVMGPDSRLDGQHTSGGAYLTDDGKTALVSVFDSTCDDRRRPARK